MQKISDPPRRTSSWGARALGALLCFAAGGVAAHQLLRKAPINGPPTDATLTDTAPTDTAATDTAPTDTGRAEATRAAEREEPTPFRLPALADQQPRQDDALPPARVERSEVLTVAGSDSADAGLPAEPPPVEPPPVEPPPAEPPLPLAETVPYAEPAPGQNCDPTPCESKVQYPFSEACGRSTCSVGQVCCNPSCGTCVNAGESCDSAPCDSSIQYPFSPICGRVTCGVGQECCNPSCGICVAPGETCNQQPCR